MFTRRFFILLSVCIAISFAACFVAPLMHVVLWCLVVLGALTVVDGIVVFAASRYILVAREHKEQLSLAQPNAVTLKVSHKLPASLKRLFKIVAYDTVPKGCTEYLGAATEYSGTDAEGTTGQLVSVAGEGTVKYFVIPQVRGRHEFGVTRCFVRSVIGLFEASRFVHHHTVVKVFPTFHNLEKIEMEATQQSHIGAQRVRRAGNNTNFEQIRPYTEGDDVRTINWRATARAVALMVNTYTDERSQPIIPVLCAGPSMLINYDGITLLDRAASAAVALASSAVRHYDEAGLITLTHQGVQTYLKPERSQGTVVKILSHTYDFGLPPTESEQPYIQDRDVVSDDIDATEYSLLLERQEACEADADFDALADYVLRRISRKSLLVLFANFENIEIARQMLPALQRMSRKHKVVVVMFENESVTEVARAPYTPGARVSNKLSELRFRALCTEYIEQQQLVVAQLRKSNINVILTAPTELTSAVLQEYLEIKKRAAL